MDKFFFYRPEDDNKEKNVEIEIPQGFPVLSIFFFIYISDVFNNISEKTPLPMSLLFVDDLGFIALGNLVKGMVKTLKSIAKAILD